MNISEAHTKIAEGLLEQAKKQKKGRRVPGYNDDKFYVPTKNGIEALINAGGLIISLNEKEAGPGYIHKVEYKGHLFILATSQEQSFKLPVDRN